MSEEKHPTPKTRRIALGDSVDGVDVSQTLMSDASRRRAAEIYSKNANPSLLVQAFDIFRDGSNGDLTQQNILRNDQIANPPETYVVKYYMTDAHTTQVSNATQAFLDGGGEKQTKFEKGKKVEKDVPYLRSDNPLVQ